jgi:glycine/D-amino acid oxidase-like deaminating enzyme/nitrite reductase/ring-hydroxylating ferredoxin subunit
MPDSSLRPVSLWQARADAPTFPALDRDLETDVLVIGGGITGLTTAALLRHAGVDVTLVEARTLGGQTGRSTGHLTELVDGTYTAILRDHGEEAAVLVRTAARDAIENVRRLCERYAPRAAYRRVPAYLYPATPDDADRVAEEADAAEAAGVHVQRGAAVPVPYPVDGAICVPDQADFDPLAYVHGLARGLADEGLRIYEHTRMAPPSGGEMPEAVTEDGRFTIRARRIVVATHSPIGVSPLHTAVAPYDSYVVAFTVPDGVAPDALVFDSGDPYHYTRTFRDGRETVLVVGGSDRKTGHNHEAGRPFDEVAEWVQARYPGAVPRERWSGMWFQPIDGLPFIGEAPLSENVYVATGFSGDGLLWGAAAGRILADLVQDVHSPFADVVSARRFKPVAGGPTWLKENLDVAVSLVKDRFVADVASAAALLPGEGGLVFDDGSHLAVFRDEGGALHTLSPICTHLHCVVRWDGAGRVWACPCHGSRFDPETGEVVDGPASAPLVAPS